MAVARLNIPYRMGQPALPQLAALRRQMSGAVGRYPRHVAVNAEYQHWGGIRCLVLTPPEVTGQLLYFHGGGFRIGSPELASGFASHLAVRSQCRIILPFYSLAPEQPFPNALLDGQAVLEALLEEARTKEARGEPAPLWLGGDSAGGNLAAVLSRRFAARIRGVVLLSPWLDLRVQADSFARNEKCDTVFSKAAAESAAALYLQGHSALDGDASPLLANLETLPPCCIVVGGDEVLLDDAVSFARALTSCGRAVTLRVLDGMAHVEPVTMPSSDQGETVLDLMASFIRSHPDS